jgi:hypothetical protein
MNRKIEDVCKELNEQSKRFAELMREYGTKIQHRHLNMIDSKPVNDWDDNKVIINCYGEYRPRKDIK